MKFGLVGIGRWGQTYIKTLKEVSGAKLVAICSKNSKSDLGIPHFHTLHNLLENTEVDTVIIATHPDSHFDLSLEALYNGKNVICEKPCMFTDDEFWEIQKMSHAKDKIFFTDYTNLYHNVIKKMEDLIPTYKGQFELKLINSGPGPIRSYSNLWDYGSHVASVMFHLFPKSFFSVEKVEFDKDGNYSIIVNSADVRVKAVFGNKSKERHHFFELSVPNDRIYWENDRSENPLKVMLNEFVLNKVQSNFALSKVIHDLLSEIENMNKAPLKGSY